MQTRSQRSVRFRFLCDNEVNPEASDQILIRCNNQLTVHLQLHSGRPLCKLTLGGEFLGSENELMTNLVCSVFSQPPPLEVAWFRSNQQLLVNKTEAALSALKIPIMVLNRQQEYMLADIAARPSANFKCLARNQFGYSESCELSQPDRQMLLSECNTHRYDYLDFRSTTD